MGTGKGRGHRERTWPWGKAIGPRAGCGHEARTWGGDRAESVDADTGVTPGKKTGIHKSSKMGKAEPGWAPWGDPTSTHSTLPDLPTLLPTALGAGGGHNSTSP